MTTWWRSVAEFFQPKPLEGTGPNHKLSEAKPPGKGPIDSAIQEYLAVVAREGEESMSEKHLRVRFEPRKAAPLSLIQTDLSTPEFGWQRFLPPLEGDPLLPLIVASNPLAFPELAYLETVPWSVRRVNCEARPSCPVHDETWSDIDDLPSGCLRCLSKRTNLPDPF